MPPDPDISHTRGTQQQRVILSGLKRSGAQSKNDTREREIYRISLML